MNNKKEIRGIYNTTFNDKNATPILKDINNVENAIIEVITMYVRGYHNFDRDRGLGSEHIKLHLGENAEGAVSIKELVNLGNSLREYLKIFKEPFIDRNGGKIYEWQNDDGVRFRAIVDKQRGGPQLPLSPSSDQIITFYSDRNLNAERGKTRMQFKNPQVEAYYKQQAQQAMIQRKEAKSKDKEVSKDREKPKDKDMEI